MLSKPDIAGPTHQPKKHHNIDTPSLEVNLIWISNTTLTFYYQNKTFKSKMIVESLIH